MRRKATGWWDNKVPFDHAHIEDQRPFAEDLRVPGAISAIRAAMQACVPAATNNGGLRRYRAGFVRFLALAWVCNREGFQERNEKEFARSMGLTQQCFDHHVGHWRRMFAGEHRNQMKLPIPGGSFPGDSRAKVPPRAAVRS
jgi:hypothetical protein